MVGEAVQLGAEPGCPSGIVLWEYIDTGRPRALVRHELPGGVVVRRLHWRDELTSVGPLLELGLRVAQ